MSKRSLFAEDTVGESAVGIRTATKIPVRMNGDRINRKAMVMTKAAEIRMPTVANNVTNMVPKRPITGESNVSTTTTTIDSIVKIPKITEPTIKRIMPKKVRI